MPALNTMRIGQYLRDAQFTPLFVEELGWDRYQTQPLQVAADGHAYTLRALAQKRGMVIYGCAGDDGTLPAYAARRAIEARVGKTTHEHLIIYTDAALSAQVWQWVKREPGRPAACREQAYHRGQSGEALIQRLRGLSVALEEEEDLTIIEVVGKVRRSLDVDRVTKRFYERFKAEHTAFLKVIEGIREQGDRE